MEIQNSNSKNSLAEPPQIEQLEILELLGRGGMSSVYKAKQILLERIVAVKVLLPNKNLDETALKRFQQEAKLSAALDHPNIARTLGFGCSNNGQVYLLMEYIDGQTLAEELKDKAPIKFGRFKEIFLPLLSALEHAHDTGLVHRDIKPSNIMLSLSSDGSETVKLLDFGVATLNEEEGQNGSQRLTKTGTVIGSPAYMSPEQCQGKSLDGRSDIYSLCCVMYESLCGELPFSGNSALEIMHQHARSPLPSTRELSRRLALPAPLSKLILSGLAKDPASRPNSAKEFAQTLSKLLDEITLDRAPRIEPAAQTNFRMAWLTGFILICLTGTAVLLGFFYQRQTAEKTAADLKHKSNYLTVNQLSEKAAKLSREGKYVDECLCWDMVAEKMRDKQRPLPADTCALASNSALRASSSLSGKSKQHYLEKSLRWSEQGLGAAMKCQDKHAFLVLCEFKKAVLSEESRFPELIKFSEVMLEASQSFERNAKLKLRNLLISDRFVDEKPEESEAMLKEAIREISAERPIGETYGLLLLTKLNLVKVYERRARTKDSSALLKEVGKELLENQDIPAAVRNDIFMWLIDASGNDAKTRIEIVLADIRKHRELFADSPHLLSTIEMLVAQRLTRLSRPHESMALYEDAWKVAQLDKTDSNVRREVLRGLINVCESINDLAKQKLYKNELAKLDSK